MVHIGIISLIDAISNKELGSHGLPFFETSERERSSGQGVNLVASGGS